ncbi:transcriptional regulator [Cenarchaeum symbiosum A]|uniref:Transcriptional regulator n=1 Tax=Cenarchaeum symbiosum (strain A) TaxID=414004 RepID=A0RWH8_CENSY|nr:transcriptional regulator [Cenarchaeum symbiosum A]
MEQSKLRTIPLEKLELWEEANVRKDNTYDNIRDLARNIKKNGLQAPLLVKEKDRKYFVFSGQRKLAACRMINMKGIPCFVFKDIKEVRAKILSLSENIYREKMTREDKSNAAASLYKQLKSISAVAKALGVKEKTVRGYLDYEAMPDKLKDFARGKGLTTKQVEDIYMKFSDTSKALTIARKLSRIDDRNKKRKMHIAIQQASMFDNAATIEKRADKLSKMKPYRIILSSKDSEVIEFIAKKRNLDGKEMLVEITEGWIRGFMEGNS